MRALIVDDHPIARRGLRTLLDEGFELERVVELDTGVRALEESRRLRPHLVLLDLQIPGPPTAAVVCRQLRAGVPRAKIAIVTAFDRLADIKQCIAAGAHGCLLKDSSDVDMVGALQALVRGERVMSPRLAKGLASDMVDVLRGQTATPQLTHREREVLGLLAEGCSNRMIADRLVLAETTVKGYVGSLLEKLNARSRLQAVVKAADLGLL